MLWRTSKKVAPLLQRVAGRCLLRRLGSQLILAAPMKPFGAGEEPNGDVVKDLAPRKRLGRLQHVFSRRRTAQEGLGDALQQL